MNPDQQRQRLSRFVRGIVDVERLRLVAVGHVLDVILGDEAVGEFWFLRRGFLGESLELEECGEAQGEGEEARKVGM
jgi:hypothetical protein